MNPFQTNDGTFLAAVNTNEAVAVIYCPIAAYTKQGEKVVPPSACSVSIWYVPGTLDLAATA